MAKPKIKKPSRKTLPPITRLPLPERDYSEIDIRWDSEPAPVAPQSVTNTPPLGSTKAPVMIVEPDPLAGSAGLIYVLAGQRMLSFAQSYPQEVNPEAFVRVVLSRLVAKDPSVKVLVAVEDGEIVGHVLATIERSMTDCWVFCWQAQIDARNSGILQQMLDIGAVWGKQQGASRVFMATQLDPVFWEHRYNFKTVRHVMAREL